jgi:hypothetical protein
MIDGWVERRLLGVSPLVVLTRAISARYPFSGRDFRCGEKPRLEQQETGQGWNAMNRDIE